MEIRIKEHLAFLGNIRTQTLFQVISLLLKIINTDFNTITQEERPLLQISRSLERYRHPLVSENSLHFTNVSTEMVQFYINRIKSNAVGSEKISVEMLHLIDIFY